MYFTWELFYLCVTCGPESYDNTREVAAYFLLYVNFVQTFKMQSLDEIQWYGCLSSYFKLYACVAY